MTRNYHGEPLEEDPKEWRTEFYKICRELNLREETVSGFDEIGLMENFISSLLKRKSKTIEGLKREILKSHYFKTPHQDKIDESYNSGLEDAIRIISE